MEQTKEAITQKMKSLLSDLFKYDYFSFLSLVTVLSGARPVGRLVISKEKAEFMKDILFRYGFYSDYQLRAATSEAFDFEGGKNSWSYTPEDRKHYESNNTYFYVSKDMEKIEELMEVEKIGDSEKGGLLLGYPECCVKKCMDNIRKGAPYEPAILLSALDASEKKGSLPFYTNYGSFGKTLTLHYPCSYECKESVLLAKKHLGIINSISQKFSEEIIASLKTSVFLNDSMIVYFKKDMLKKEGSSLRGTAFSCYGENTKEIREIKVENSCLVASGRQYQGKFCYFD